ncbi:MAG: hypothetical protein ACOC6G_04350 [Thermoproteota archaeon]
MFVVLLISTLGLSLRVLEVTGDQDVFSTVGGAEQLMEESYEAVSEAEEAGADVSSLLEELNHAGQYLTVAKACLRIGNFEDAKGNATLCIEGVEGIQEEARVLGSKAVKRSVRNSWIMISGSAIAVIGVVYGGWWGWKRFKRWYHQQNLESKKEGIEDES